MTRLNLGKELLDLIHPIGSTIFNKNVNFNPNELWIGTSWENLGCCVLMGCDQNDSKYSQAGTYVGENEHTLTISEMPSHNHNILWGVSTGVYYARAISSDNADINSNLTPDTVRFSGGNQPHNNVQRSYLGYWWIRIS